MAEWIEHDGKGIPVSEKTIVIVRFRDGSPHYEHEDRKRAAGCWHSESPCGSNWHHDGSGGDITEYSIISREEEETGAPEGMVRHFMERDRHQQKVRQAGNVRP